MGTKEVFQAVAGTAVGATLMANVALADGGADFDPSQGAFAAMTAAEECAVLNDHFDVARRVTKAFADNYEKIRQVLKPGMSFAPLGTPAFKDDTTEDSREMAAFRVHGTEMYNALNDGAGREKISPLQVRLFNEEYYTMMNVTGQAFDLARDIEDSNPDLLKKNVCNTPEVIPSAFDL